MRPDFPFSAIVGQEDLKLALLLVAVDPSIGGVLISGERGTAKSTAARGIAALLPVRADGAQAPFVELPLGATEDRVVGSLDISQVLKDGSAQLRCGLLSRADEGVLYVDEVNLLPDHLVDLLLDAAASGSVKVERDGVSAVANARFVLVGTMNPEEGDLRPQFLDRFGLCVQVKGFTTQETRTSAIRRRLSFDDNPSAVIAAAQGEQSALHECIIAARKRLAALIVTDEHLALVASLASEHRLDGIRGDLAIIKTARALAAWERSQSIDEAHIRRAAEFALPHRSRQKNVDRPPMPPPARQRSEASAAEEHAAPPVERLPVRLLTDVIDRTSSGRRGTDASLAKRVVGIMPYENTGSLAITETLRAAATRGARVTDGAVRLSAKDLRQHRRSGPGQSHVLFLVDVSGSMAMQRRLQVAKGAALGLLNDSYQSRDEVALMVFRGEQSSLLAPFTRDVARVERALADVPTGGRTPLARALLDAAQLLRSRASSLAVLLTDGRANVPAQGGDPWQEALAAAAELRAAAGGILVIDCETGPILLGRARTLAQAMSAECIALDAMDSSTLTVRIHRRLERL